MVRIIWNKKQDLENQIEINVQKYKNSFSKIEKLSYYSKSNKKLKLSSKSWINKLFWGENLEVLYYLLNELEEKIDLIYIDPPFFSGSNYHIEIKNEQNNYDVIAYNDYWKNDLDTYLQILYERIISNLWYDKKYW